jgi:hypothetical protein
MRITIVRAAFVGTAYHKENKQSRLILRLKPPSINRPAGASAKLTADLFAYAIVSLFFLWLSHRWRSRRLHRPARLRDNRSLTELLATPNATQSEEAI